MYKQLGLFDSQDEDKNHLQTVYKALSYNATLAISISGGKDSQALLKFLSQERQTHRWQGECFAIHADLGRAEWKQTPAHVEAIAQKVNLPLVVVKREAGDLIDRFKERKAQLAKEGNTKPFWSDSKNRYCTSDLKRGPINKYLRKFSFVISAEGVRAEESKNRAQKPVLSVREEISSKRFHGLTPDEALSQWDTRGRLAFTWNAIHDWGISQVWEWCETSSEEVSRRQRLFRQGHAAEALDGFPAHPAYVFGNARLSCALCILATKNDLINGAKHNPEVFHELLAMEEESGWTFKKDLSLRQIAEAIGC
jgi:3'-phosphoadenosine 5'-phosphosulfate sulfotransferase (PAPS reductase)/FAD synthetase